MPIETENQLVAPEQVAENAESEPEGSPPALALERIYRLRRFKLHAVAFLLGVPILGGISVAPPEGIGR